MAITKEHDEEGQHHHEQHMRPLLYSELPPSDYRTSLIQKAINQTFKSTAHLANLLPTGTVLAFQLLSTIFTNLGRYDPASRTITACLIAVCGLSSFILCFTDSFRDGSGTARYGLATFRGLWVIDGTERLPPEVVAGYRLRSKSKFLNSPPEMEAALAAMSRRRSCSAWDGRICIFF